jgi:hypothetical protein
LEVGGHGWKQNSVANSYAPGIYTINSVQYSLRLNLSFQNHPAQRDDTGATPTAFNLQRFVESHQRFIYNELSTLRDTIGASAAAVGEVVAPADPWPPPSVRHVFDVIVAAAVAVPG